MIQHLGFYPPTEEGKSATCKVVATTLAFFCRTPYLAQSTRSVCTDQPDPCSETQKWLFLSLLSIGSNGRSPKSCERYFSASAFDDSESYTDRCSARDEWRLLERNCVDE